MINNKLQNFFKLNIIICLLIHKNLSYSLVLDNKQPLVITSNNFEINYNQGYALYHGAVTLNQGSRHLESEQLYLYFENNNSKTTNTAETNKIKEIKAMGNNSLVKYSEDMKQKDSKIKAEANIMKFSPKDNLLTLEKGALIEQNGRRLTSELLHYNTKTEVAYTPKLNNKRTKVILG